MSIINEALKRAVREKQGVAVTPEDRRAVRRRLDTEYRSKRMNTRRGVLFVTLFFGILTAVLVLPRFWVLHPAGGPPRTARAGVTQSAPLLPQTQARSAQFGIEESPLLGGDVQPIASAPRLTLSGIAYSGEEAYCLINDRVVKVGQTVADAKLTKISEEEVRLDYKGREIVLTL